MLYERWLAVARERPGEVAVWDLASGRRWTFGELRALGESGRGGLQQGQVRVVRGRGMDFIVGVLDGWREGRAVLPLEEEERVPELRPVPAWCGHVKRTSATSGAAKTVLFREEQLLADVEQIMVTMGLRVDWPNIGAISTAHSYGFSNLILPLLLFGVPLVLVDQPLPERMREALQLRFAGGYTVPAVPALWRAWHESGILSERIRLAISAGAPLPVVLERDIFHRAKVKVHNFLGASECGGIAYDTSSEPRQDGSLAGTAMHGVQLALDKEGRLRVRSAAVGACYWPDEDQGLDLGGGEFVTSDLAEIRDGWLVLRGRLGDVIHVAGRKVAPETIEQAVLGSGLVSACLAFGVPAEGERGEKVVCAVVWKETGNEGERARDLDRRVKQRLAPWQRPRVWWPVPEIKENARGKVSRGEWRERFAKREGGRTEEFSFQ